MRWPGWSGRQGSGAGWEDDVLGVQFDVLMTDNVHSVANATVSLTLAASSGTSSSSGHQELLLTIVGLGRCGRREGGK